MFLSLHDFTICLWCLNTIQYVENKMSWKKWTTLSCNYPTYHLCGLWFSCNNLLTIFFEHTHHSWHIGEYTQLCPIVSFIFVMSSLLFCVVPLVCNLGFKVRFQKCSRKGGHENGSEYGTIIPNGNTQHFVSNMWNILLNTFCCLHVYVIYFHSFVCFVSRSMIFKNQISIVLS
jgi:hypothetical protein